MILQLLEFFGLLFVVGYLVNEYSDKQVKKHIKILSFIAWLLSFGFVFIIPLDIYWTLENQRFIDNCKQNPQSEECLSFEGDIPEFKTMVWAWRAVYWITFVFTWFILPFFQDYEAAGEFDVQGRVKRSIKINLMIILGIGAIGLLFIVYLLISGKISWDNLEGFLIGLANGFGIFLVVILLGHGLVMIPKQCWRERNEETTIKLCQFQAAKLDEAKLETVFKLEEKVKFLLLAQQRYKEFESYFNQIIDLVPADIVSHCKELNQPSETTRQDLNSFGVINIDKLATLNKDMKQLVQQLKREQTKWDYLLDKAFFTEDLKKNKDSSENKIDSDFYVNRQGKLGHFIDVAFWFWNCKAKKIFMIICAFTFGMLSLLVLLGEISIFSGKVINPFHYILVDDTTHMIGTQFLVLVPLLYITFCVYYSMFQVKLANLFGLYKYHQTDAPSLMFFSINFARVSAPISYNYLKILGVKDSAFERIIGAMDDVPILGSANTYFFPMILIMLILFNAFDVYQKILSSLGLKQFEFSDSFDDERIDQGKQLIQRARNSWAKKFDKMKQTSPSMYAGYNTASSLRENEQIKNFGRGYGNNSDVSGDTESRASTSSASTSSQQKYSQSQQNKLKQSIGNKLNSKQINIFKSINKKMEGQIKQFRNFESFIKSNQTDLTQIELFFADQNLNQETFFQFSSQLALCTQARHLLLFLKSFENLGDQGAIEFGKALSQLQKLTYLKLIFYRINIGSQGFQSISAGLSNCTQLEYLSINFSQNQIGDEGAQAIGLAFTKCINITDLSFFFNKNNIGDKGISAIAQGMSNCIRVKTLCLSSQENRISEDGYHILNQSIANLPKLTTFKAFIKDQHEDYLKSKEIINCNNIKIVALHLQDIIVHIRKALKMLRLVKLIVYK